MDQQTYTSLVHSLEVDATIHPGRFRGKVILLGSMAYLVLFGLLAALALLFWFAFEAARAADRAGSLIRLGLFALFMAPVFVVVLRMFFMRLPVPEGRVLLRADAPKLFGLIDKMRKQLKGPPIHHVLLDDEFNAAIFQRPRLGLFGGHTNYLILGLPYMLSMSPQEMAATVAHEYGHVCGNHGKVSAWIYRQRQTFTALYQQIGDGAGDNLVYGLLAGLLGKFMPYYSAHTFVLSRQNEYDADLTATELVGAKPNAAGLIRGELLGRWIDEEFWPTLLRQADTRDKPAFLPFSAMGTAFKAGYGQWATSETLARAWGEKSDLYDTHPALRERVEATGERCKLPACIDVSAAEALLGGRTRMLVDEFDQRWWQREKKEWRARFQYASRAQARLLELRRAPLDALKLQELQELAVLSAEFEQPDKVVLAHLLAQPGGPFPRAEYEYGCLLLAGRDDKGLGHLANAGAADARLRDKAARVGFSYLAKYGDERQAQQWCDRVVAG
ncbi:M48 family metallopeptidase [Massilia glaciei]|uniref:Peptidase M48 domain-containing protein n=1 Tax=Massilia glaciei TaxID=1524097 RepID=A0A2U2HMW0_9BURK|nr:M48 family metallopeptidase [Massilia glaciei]PWF48766.1 hypothetical protein C7C56_009835 [Massilia glaciei]